ncbi:terminase small subunit [Acinetobacter baumannii]|uniref:terminase small subunit n=2 Tax=Acinetobacter baumannii TaxID=470 RepID=UPI0004172D58|nr:terminase small subunit [Acinetobacter baumannii]EKT9123477.1 terminase small subunit [Acinetobacter baumannii]EKT9311954.1 terminase small subunit [Acinetobacter baumannii]EKU0107706.1 terminase small subunit [Acinetobacter baumannii]EKU0260063.1 terminase small subunit [Acinetobacter baumannii]EKU3007891.1 terminase small subunit [Acinetobacter baumannii]
MALTEKMEKFALAIVDGKTNKEAAISAGYAEKTASAAGARLAKDPEIIVYIEMLKAKKEGRSLTSDRPNVKPENKPENSGEDENPIEEFQFEGDDPLDFLIKVMNFNGNKLPLRMQAAIAALPYKHGKVAEKGKKETKAETAREGSKSGKFATLDNQLMS